MAEAAKKTVKAPPKVFRIPPNLIPLEQHATVIINQMRAAHRWRMTEGVKQMRKKSAAAPKA